MVIIMVNNITIEQYLKIVKYTYISDYSYEEVRRFCASSLWKVLRFEENTSQG